jgi:acetyltransferase
LDPDDSTVMVVTLPVQDVQVPQAPASGEATSNAS